MVPDDLQEVLGVANAAQRLGEAVEMAGHVLAAGVPLQHNLDHAAIFTDPPARIAGALKTIGYVNGSDHRCYPSPVDGCDYINVPASLPDGAPARERGWFDHVAVVHPVDDAARDMMESHGYGNPFLHHVTWRITAPAVDGDDFARAEAYVPFMRDCRERIGKVLEAEPGALVIALPQTVIDDARFGAALRRWTDGLDADAWQAEPMQGGGFLIQFFCLQGGKIEVALREGTSQVFNPASVHRISEREISTDQG